MASFVGDKMMAAEAHAATLDAKVAPLLDRWSNDQRRRLTLMALIRELADPTLDADLIRAAMRRWKDRRALNTVVSFRLTEADYHEHISKVEASGLTQSDFYRRHVLHNTTVVLARPRCSVDRERMLYLVSKAGNNLNQMAHRIHTDHLSGSVGEAAYQQVLSVLTKIEGHLDEAVKNVD